MGSNKKGGENGEHGERDCFDLHAYGLEGSKVGWERGNLGRRMGLVRTHLALKGPKQVGKMGKLGES